MKWLPQQNYQFKVRTSKHFNENTSEEYQHHWIEPWYVIEKESMVSIIASLTQNGGKMYLPLSPIYTSESDDVNFVND